MAGGRDEACACQETIRIEGNIALQKIIIRIPVDKCRNVRTDQSLLAIRDINEGVKQIDRLLFVFRESHPGWIERESARKRDRRCEFCIHPCALTEWRNRCAHDALRQPFLVDIRDIKDFETARAIRGIEVLATQDQVLNVVATVLMS